MSNYTTEYIRHKLITVASPIDGEIKHQEEWTEKKIKNNKSNKQGMSMFKKNDYIAMQEYVVSSKLELRLWNFIVSNFKQCGHVQLNLKDITITELTKEFNITRQKVSSFIRKAIECGFIQKRGTLLYVNPFVVVPYEISDDNLHTIQKVWDKNNNDICMKKEQDCILKTIKEKQ